MKEFISIVRQALKDKGMTQIDLANKVDLTETQINHLLCGRRNFTAETINKISKVLGIKIQFKI